MINFTDIGDGEPIVFIHGLGNNRQIWNPQLPLVTRYRLIIIELRGHGESNITENLNLSNYVKDIVDLLDHLNIEKAHICGLSLGGLTALELHKFYRYRVKSLILANTTFYIPSFISRLAKHETQKLIKDIGYDELKKLSIKFCLNSEDSDLIKIAEKGFTIREDTYLNASLSGGGKDYYLDLLSIKIPILLIGGENDKITPVINMYMMSIWSGGKLKLFKDCGHLSNIDRTDDFNKAIVEHIERVCGN